MERLTHKRANGIKTGYWSPSKKDELIERLAAYEDSGLMPEDVKTLVDRNKPVTVSLPDGTWWVKDNNGESVPWDMIPHCIYGALCKLHDYEKIGLSPSDVEQLLEGVHESRKKGMHLTVDEMRRDGYPLEIEGNGGYHAFLVGCQPLLDGDYMAIYRYPHGDCCHDLEEIKRFFRILEQ